MTTVTHQKLNYSNERYQNKNWIVNLRNFSIFDL